MGGRTATLSLLLLIAGLKNVILVGVGNEDINKTCNIAKENISNITMPSCASCDKSCGNASNLYQDRACSCDANCKLNGDCCQDFKVKCPLEYKMSQDLFPIVEKPSCVNTNWPQVGDESNYLLISDCYDKKQCTVSTLTPNMLIPVYDNVSQQHFVNMNCAVCHGMCNIVPWETEVICPDVEDANDVNKSASNVSIIWGKIQKGICRITTYPTENMLKPRKCLKEAIRSCPVICANSSLETDCFESDLVYIEGDIATYANPACMYCNEGFNEEVKCRKKPVKEQRLKRALDKFSFNLLFDFDPSKGILIGDESVECYSDDDCVVYNKDICTEIQFPMPEITFLINVTEIYQNSTLELMESVRHNLSDILYSKIPHYEILIDAQPEAKWSVTIVFEEGMEFNETQLRHIILEYFNMLFENDNIIIVDKMQTFSKQLDCIIREYTTDEYEQETNESIKIKENGRVIHYNSYYIYNKNAYVCIEEWLNVNLPGGFGIVTIICTGLSILCLIMRLLLHWMVPQTTEKMTNKFRVSLVVALLSAMVSFILHPLVEEIPKLCYVVSVWIHWSFLAAFSWMTAIAVDITRMLRATQKLRQVENTPKLFLIYSIIAWGIPTLIVTLTVGLDYTRISWYWRPHYGETICWISSKYALLAYFVTPVAAAIAINICMFITSTILLSKLQAGPSYTQHQSHKDRLCLHVKLLTLMGLTWIFGFLAAPLHSDTLWYIFIVLNASQGVFLLLVYLFSSQFRKFMKEKKRPRSETYRLTGPQTVDTSL